MRRAIELLVTDEVVHGPKVLPPLSMPEVPRRRKAPSDDEWCVYGNDLPFDMIPVVPTPKK